MSEQPPPTPIRRGVLATGASAPAEGEQALPLLELPGLVIEQILSAELPHPLRFLQDHDEWVLVLEGRARLELDGSELELRAGEWLYLPAGCAHSVQETEAGTSWLAVHVKRPD